MNIYSVGNAIASSHVGGQHDVMWNALYYVDWGGIEISWGTVEYTLLDIGAGSGGAGGGRPPPIQKVGGQNAKCVFAPPQKREEGERKKYNI